MPRPENVNPHNFRVESVVYNDGDFSIAWGEWKDGSYHLAMRWNGENNAGYPKTFGHPVWFLLPDSLTVDIIRGILGNSNSNKVAIVQIIQASV